MNPKDIILCIDDEPIIRKLIKGQLESKYGDRFIIELAEDVESAAVIIENIKNSEHTLVMAIVDQILPGKQGTEFLTEISEEYPNIVKILFSGKSDFNAVIAAINEAEIFRYLIKPWDEVDFLNIVERGLQQFYIKENIDLQLAEIHHRVKNNLTIITCLLELQINELKDEPSRNQFRQSINRINSIAKVHELIYESEDMASVDIKEYLEKIIPAIQATLRSKELDLHIDFSFEIPSHKLKVNQAIPLGLIFNELITNSFKYAFEDTDHPKISILMQSDGNRLTFTYEDNGKGFERTESFNQTKKLGLTLVHLQLQQLESVYTVDSDQKFKLSFTFDSGRAKNLNGALRQLTPIAF